MLRCASCSRIIPAAENKFKFPGEPGSVHFCNTCGNKRIQEASAETEPEA